MLKFCLFLAFLSFSLADDNIASPSVAATLVDPSPVAAPSSQVAVKTEAAEETHSFTSEEKVKTLEKNVPENTNKSLNENKMEKEETKTSTETVSENTQTNEIVTSAEAVTKNEKTKTETVASSPETETPEKRPETIPETTPETLVPETLSSVPSNDESITKTEKIETPEPKLFDDSNPKETQQTQQLPDDDYYGLLQNPVDHLDRAAFQPSHTFVLSIDPGETMSLYEDVANINVGKVVRGSWFVTNGDIKVTISESSQGSILYSSSSDSTNGDIEQQKEGSFRFVIPRPGKLTILLENPSPSLRAVSFAWLLGSDDDDPYVAKRSARDGIRERFDERKGGGGEGGGVFSGGNEKDANSFTQSMLKKVSTLHKDIDDVISLQQFADVRFARHLDTVESNKRRLLWWTITETIVILVSSALHVIVVQHVFDYRGFKRAFV